MQRFGIPCILVAIVLWAGCGKDAPVPANILATDTTICRLVMVASEIPSLPHLNYTVSFMYDNEARVDTAMLLYVDYRIAVKFYYSVDEHPDSLIVTHLDPSPVPGYQYRIYFGYDSDRRQVFSSGSASGDSTHYAYNADGQLILWNRKIVLNGVPRYDTVRYFYPNSSTHNFSMRTSQFYSQQLSTWTYTYDNHPLPQKFPFGVPFEVGYQSYTDNNILSGGNAQSGVQYNYSYNPAGYPIEQVLMPGAFSKFTYTYHCETLP